MIIRLAKEADEVRSCAALDHSYTTDRVWQMDTREYSGGTSISFRSVRLPRDMRVHYPRNPDDLLGQWEKRDAVLIAEDEGQIVGYLHLALQTSEDTGWVHNLVVAPHLRRRGIGTALLQAATDWLRQQNVSRLLLEMTTKSYPAIRFAQKLGFSLCGYNDRYYANQDIALFFAKSLR